jgi:hypothetical protein
MSLWCLQKESRAGNQHTSKEASSQFFHAAGIAVEPVPLVLTRWLISRVMFGLKELEHAKLSEC